MRDLIESYIQDGIDIIQLVGLLIVGAVVLTTWTKTKSAMATVSAMVVGALVLGYIYNADWVGRKVGEDITQRENGAQVFDL